MSNEFAVLLCPGCSLQKPSGNEYWCQDIQKTSGDAPPDFGNGQNTRHLVGCRPNTASFALSQPSPQRQRRGGGALLEGRLRQGAPDKERSAGGGGKLTTTLLNPPHLHALFIHCLRLSAGTSPTRGVCGRTYWAPARGLQVKSPTRTARRPRQGAPTTAPLARPIASGSAPATPTSPSLSAHPP